jgi:hypothetical protein
MKGVCENKDGSKENGETHLCTPFSNRNGSRNRFDAKLNILHPIVSLAEKPHES